MVFQVSPGISITEMDLTTVVPAVATTGCGYAGPFLWGPGYEITTIDKENVLFDTFMGPAKPTLTDNAGQAKEWLTCASFLAYGSNLKVVRVWGGSANNAVWAANTVSSSNVTVNNSTYFNYIYADNEANQIESGDYPVFIARYPGAVGNSLKVSICPSANAFSNTAVCNGVISIYSSNVTANGNGSFYTDLVNGDFIVYGSANNTVQVDHIVSNTELVLKTAPSPSQAVASTQFSRRWEFYHDFDDVPTTTTYVSERSGANDEIHVAVIDEDGEFSGTPGTLLERYAGVSIARDAKKSDGSSNYYKRVINQNSKYVYQMNHPDSIGNQDWGNVSTTTFQSDGVTAAATWMSRPITSNLKNGVDDNDVSTLNAARLEGYLLFEDPDTVDLGLLIMGNANEVLIQNVIDNVALERMDSIVCYSPQEEDTYNVSSQSLQTDQVIAFRDTVNRSTSYAVMDSTHKEMYDRYNDLLYPVPLNGDIAGLIARTEQTNDAWWSPGGFNRGKLKNVVKLYLNPRKTYRDSLYKKNINPVVSFPGEGPVLYGDKTTLTKPSAFDRINVRRLFVILEKAIARAAKYSLFEFNDEFTRSAFRNLVEPFLMDVQGRRGIYDFKVICDTSNNTPEVIDRNEFVGDIFIKPARSINFIQLNFVAARTGVDFAEIGG